MILTFISYSLSHLILETTLTCLVTQMQSGFVGQPVAMPAMAYPGQPQQQFVVQPSQAQVQPGPPPHVTGQPSQFVTGQPGQYAPWPVMAQASPGQFPGGPPGVFQQMGQGQGQGQMIGGQPVPDVSSLAPDILGMGRTRSEFAAEQANAAVFNEANLPQEFQPADPNPGRMYWVRQVDDEWVQMSRATIDNLGCRWFIWPTGVFYAVRLPD